MTMTLTQWNRQAPSKGGACIDEIKNQSLGVEYHKEKSIFRLWSPDLDSAELLLYYGEDHEESLIMQKEGEIFSISVPGDLQGTQYLFRANGSTFTDPYCVGASVNSRRSVVIDLSETNPPGFEKDSFSYTPPSEAIIYEMHVGDFSHSVSSGCVHRGKFLALTENGTSLGGVRTGLAHLKSLGITHIHLMPVFDFETVDERSESAGRDDNYNWGYDPELYNVPEGSYAQFPEDPCSRILELKKMIQHLHAQGIGVIMDVVYNHTFKTLDSNLNLSAPGRYYRRENGYFSNGSGVGNELATEKPMPRKLILDSLLYWQREYHIDGFRFDLMALMDHDIVDEILAELRKANPNVIVYGEPWTGGNSALPYPDRTVWGTQKNRGFALYNGTYRDAIRGDNDGTLRGFIQGATECKHAVEMGIVGSIHYDATHIGGVAEPAESLNYFSSHDNLILEDKLTFSLGNRDHNEAMTRLAFGILLTSEGIPFFHAGNEFRRSKSGNSNSYCAPYSINAIDWTLASENASLVQYVTDLITLRKEHEVFSLRSAEEVRRRVRIIDTGNPNVIGVAYQERQENCWMLIFHSNAWTNTSVEWKRVFDALGSYHLKVQRIFEGRGSIHVNITEISRSENLSVLLEPISTTIYRMRKQD